MQKGWVRTRARENVFFYFLFLFFGDQEGNGTVFSRERVQKKGK